MNYEVSLGDAKWMDFFDDICYKYLKDCIMNEDEDKNDDYINTEITYLPCDRVCYAKVKFIFEIKFIFDICLGETHYKTLKCEKIIEYNTSSGFALKLMQITETDEESETD